jgi:branched-chain amino acid transport system substrate-binding protein
METNGSPTGGDGADEPAATEPAAVIRTFLIADVRGYTRFTQAHGDEEAGKLATRFAALARDVVTRAGGELIELRGDEALTVFPSARQALRAAVELQRRFRERSEGEPVFPLGIGIGLDAGEAVPVEDGYRGGALNLAARLCGLAAPGQILASETVTSLARTLEEVRFVERRARVKGLEKPVRLIEVVPKEELPPVPEAPPPSKRRRALLMIGAGAVVLAASVTAAVLALTGGSEDSVESVGNAIAAIDGKAVAYTQVGTTPSTIAVGERAVWVLNADDRTISKIDPETHQIVKTFGTGGTTTDLAVGEGAVWIGNGAKTVSTGGLPSGVYTASISRLDPETTAVSHTEALPGPRRTPDADNAGEFRTLGVSQLAVGGGAVWAINPDLTVSRLDPATGAREAIIPVEVGGAIAAGREGVWAIRAGDESTHVLRIDPRTNRVAQKIDVAAEGLVGIAVGAGSVWATDVGSGLLWRIEPGPDPTARTIDVGFGITDVAYGNGAVWVTNVVRDEVARVDVRTNNVTDIVRLAGTPPSVAAAAGTAWVSIAGAPSGDSLPASVCGPILAGGRDPDVLIVSDFPLQAQFAGETPVAADAIRFVLREHGFRAGSYAVGYQSCDDSTAQTGAHDIIKCASNAKAYAATARLVGVIGPWNSECAAAQIPIANRAEGPLAMISPANTHPGLTHASPGFAEEDEPESYYPTGTRNYVRVVAPEDFQAAAAAVLAGELGLKRLYVLKTTSEFPGDSFATQFEQAARRLGLAIAGSASLEPRAKSFTAAAARVAQARADGVFFPELYFEHPGALLDALRERLGRKLVLIAPDFVGYAEPGMYVTATGRANESLGPAGRRFLREFAPTQPDGAVPSSRYILEAAQAAEALLEAIGRSDGARASVLRELRRLEVENGILGSFRFDENGDMTPPAISVFRVTGKESKADAPDFYGGADFDRLVRVPPELVGS